MAEKSTLWKFRRDAARAFLSRREIRLALIVLILPRGWSMSREDT